MWLRLRLPSHATLRTATLTPSALVVAAHIAIEYPLKPSQHVRMHFSTTETLSKHIKPGSKGTEASVVFFFDSDSAPSRVLINNRSEIKVFSKRRREEMWKPVQAKPSDIKRRLERRSRRSSSSISSKQSQLTQTNSYIRSSFP